jgi:cell division protein FtsQ
MEILTKTGIHLGDNLLALNLRLVREQLLADPWVDDARVYREIPQTIIIEIKEHQPFARVDLGRTFLMNTKGQIFKTFDKHDNSELPLISGIEYADIRSEGKHVSPIVTAILRVLEISKSKNSAIAYSDLEKIHVDKEMGIMLTLKQEHVRVQLGFDQYEKKLNRLEKLQHHLAEKRKWQNYKTIDLNDPDRVVVQFDPIG